MTELMRAGHYARLEAQRIDKAIEEAVAAERERLRRLQREFNVLNAMWADAERENKKLEAEIAGLRFELTAARNEIEIADGVIKRLQAKNAQLRAALQPFADAARKQEATNPTCYRERDCRWRVSIDDFERACRELEKN